MSRGKNAILKEVARRQDAAMAIHYDHHDALVLMPGIWEILNESKIAGARSWYETTTRQVVLQLDGRRIEIPALRLCALAKRAEWLEIERAVRRAIKHLAGQQ